MVDITPASDKSDGFRRNLKGAIIIAKSTLKAT